MSSSEHGDDLVAALLPAFIDEAHEQIEAFEQLMLQLEDTPDDPEQLDALFRCAHTIKGSAGVFGLGRVVEFTHHVESLLDRLREGQLALTPSLGTLLLQSNDTIRQLVATALDLDTDEAVQQRAALVERLHAAAGTGAMASAAAEQPHAPSGELMLMEPEGVCRWHLSVAFGSDLFRHGMDPLSVLNYLRSMGDIEALQFERTAVPELDAIDPESCHLAFSFDLLTDVPRERIEHAFSFVREDCELKLEASADDAAVGPTETAIQSASATATATAIAPETETATKTPAGAMAAAGLPSPVHSGAAVRGREADSPSSGEESSFIRVQSNRLDEVINLLGELVIAGAGASQMARQTRHRGLIEVNQQITRLIEGIRNSTLKLRMVPIGETFSRFRRVVRDTASELGKDVALEIVGGETELDKSVVERIADPLMHLVRNALDHGLETPEQRLAASKPAKGKLTLSACHESGSILIRIVDDGRGIRRDKVLERAWQRGLVEKGVVPEDADILNLIFEPGFSTAEKVTNLSGRGVGMDVVRANIEALRGSVAIESTEGQGSTIEIRLPLTLAIIDGFLVGVGASRFIFPLDTVVEVIACRSDTVVLDEQGRGCVELRGRHLPVINLRRLYAQEGTAPRTGSIVVARVGARRFGVMVDSLLGQHQTVIKPLGRLLRSLRGISGSSILGTGEVALIFDVDALGRLAAESHPTPRKPDGRSSHAADLTLAGDR